MNKLLIIFILAFLGVGIFIIAQNKSSITQTENRIPTITQTDSQQHLIEGLNLTFKTPKEFFVTQENAMNLTTNQPYGYTFYVQNYKDSPTDTNNYQLYGIYQFDTEKVEENVFGDIEKDLEDSKRSTITGLPALSGFNKGQRQRYVIYILKDGHLLTLATSQVTDENIKTTEEIVKTFTFK